MARMKAGPSVFLRNLAAVCCCLVVAVAICAAAGVGPPKSPPRPPAKASSQASAATTTSAPGGYGAELKLSYIVPGKFTMGYLTMPRSSEGTDTRHEVTLTHGYYIGTYLVTEDQVLALLGNRWLSRCGDRPYLGEDVSSPKFQVYYSPQSPVVPDWATVEAFCKELSRKTGNKVRLPTEAEWEYAYRAGTKTTYFWGDDPKDGADYVPPYIHKAQNQNEADRHGLYDGLRPRFGDVVGRVKPNPWGLYDLCSGAQWCSDWVSPWRVRELVIRTRVADRAGGGCEEIPGLPPPPGPETDPKGPAYASRPPGVIGGAAGYNGSEAINGPCATRVHVCRRGFWWGSWVAGALGERGLADGERTKVVGGGGESEYMPAGRVFLRVVVEGPLAPPPSEFVGVFKFGGMRQGRYQDEPSFIAVAVAVVDGTKIGNAAGPLPLVVVRPPPADAAHPETPKPIPAPKAGEAMQLAIPNKPPLPPPPPKPVPGSVFAPRGPATKPAAAEKPEDPKAPRPEEAVYGVLKSAKPGDLLRIKYTQLANEKIGCIVCAGPYAVKPGEDRPGVYFFVKRTTEKVGNDLRQAIVVQKFEQDFTLLVPTKRDAAGASRPDMDMLTFIDDLKPGDCMMIELNDKTIRSITKYAPPASEPSAGK